MGKIYLGRMCGAGLTRKGEPFVVYLVSGRSQESRERKFLRHPDKNPHTIEIKCIRDIPPEEKENREYNVMVSSPDGFIVCTNGVQTDYIFKNAGRLESGDMINYMNVGLNKHGPEKEGTPRIGIIADNYKGFCSGIVSKNNSAESAFFLYEDAPEGVARTIRTYEGYLDRLVPPDDPRGFGFTLHGFTAKELTEELFKLMEKEYTMDLTVGTAAAVWNSSKGWEMESKDRYG